VDQRPPYLRIADELRRRIRTGQFAEGDPLPSQAQIADEFDVSDGVARRALRTLVSEGLAIARIGAGTFVRKQPTQRRLIRSWSREMRGGSPFASEMAAQGLAGTWEYKTNTQQAPPEIRERLAMVDPAGDEPDAVRTFYVYKGGEEPVQIATSWEPLALTRGTPIVAPEDGPHAGEGVVDRMAQIGVEVTHYVDEISPRPARKEESDLLVIPPSSMVHVIERTYWADTRPVETADIVVGAEKWRLVYAVPVIRD
jgi:DNA-binding GntR family transcriptional regulator